MALNPLTLLSFEFSTLSGSLPTELSNLSTLSVIRAQQTGLSINLTYFCDFPNLARLYLQSNSLTGTFPACLTSLQRALLSNNQLSGTVPPFQIMYPGVVWFDFSNNDLSGPLPPVRSNGAIFLFYASGNQLDGTIPSAYFAEVVELNVNDNNLTALTEPNISSPFRMELLYAARNKISGTIPSELFVNLNEIDLWDNQLSGTVPDALGPNLVSLDVRTNQLTGSLPKLYSPNLWGFGASFNSFTGTFPAALSNAPNVVFFELSNNQLSGTVPDLILPSLTRLDLSYNQLEGRLPSIVSPRLDFLSFAHNNFTIQSIYGGKKILLPENFEIDLSFNRIHYDGFLALLDWNRNIFHRIDFSGNPLSKIPSSFAPRQENLESLILSQNSLVEINTDPLDHAQVLYQAEVSSITSLVLTNQLFRSLPEALCLQTRTQEIDLSDNLQMGGTIPSCLSELDALRLLDVRNTAVTITINGALPSQARSSNSTFLSDNFYSCQQFEIVKPDSSVLTLLHDPSLHEWQFCECLTGYYGQPPNPCLECPDNAICNGPSVLCKTGFYMSIEAVECLTCPEFALCENNTISPLAGYWLPVNFTNNSQVYECFNPDACIGQAAADNQCLSGCYVNNSVLCGVCSADCVQQGFACSECPSTGQNITILVLFILLQLGLIALGLYGALAFDTDAEDEDLMGGLLKIGVSGLQLLGLFRGFQVRWTAELLSLYDGVNQVSGGTALFGVDCAFHWQMNGEDYFTKFWLNLVFPAFLYGIVLVALLIVKLVLHLRSDSFPVRRRLLPAFVVVIFFVHTDYTVQVLGSSNCLEIDGVSYLEPDLSVACGSSKQRLAAILGVVGFIVVGLLLPLIGLGALLRYRKKLHDEHVQSHWGFMYDNFKIKWFFWEWIIVLRKVLILLLSIYLNSESDLQIWSGVVVLVAALVVHLQAKPYKAGLLNRMETASLCVSLITLGIGLLFWFDEYKEAHPYLAGVILFFNALFYIVWAILLIINARAKARKLGAVASGLAGKVLNRSKNDETDELSSFQQESTTEEKESIGSSDESESWDDKGVEAS